MDYFNDFEAFLENMISVPSILAKSAPEAAAGATGVNPVAGTSATPATTAAAATAATKEAPQKPATLQDRLKEWIQTYSQAFKFINDRPLPTEYKPGVTPTTGSFTLLINSITPEKRAKVTEGITKVIEILLNKGFEGQQVLVLGHTSTPGPKGREVPYNQALSERRAGVVFNSIKELSFRDQKDLSKIKFTVVGKGLSDPIIQNDKDLQPLKVKQMDGTFDADTLMGLSKSVEERQKINRRVIITLPDYTEPVPVVKVIPVEKPKDLVKDIVPIDVQGITFYDDSYLLTKNGREILDRIVTGIKSREGTQQKIKKVYLAAHTEKGNGDEEREHMMFILSLNRSFVVRDYLQSRIAKDIEFVRYGCGSQISPERSDLDGFSDEKRVEIAFDSDLPKAKAAYNTLTTKFGVSPKSGIVVNTIMKATIKKSIGMYFADESVRNLITAEINDERNPPEYCEKIPREFWLKTDYNDKGEEDPSDFKQSIEVLVANNNKKYGCVIPVKTFYHRDLTRNLE